MTKIIQFHKAKDQRQNNIFWEKYRIRQTLAVSAIFIFDIVRRQMFAWKVNSLQMLYADFTLLHFSFLKKKKLFVLHFITEAKESWSRKGIFVE